MNRHRDGNVMCSLPELIRVLLILSLLSLLHLAGCRGASADDVTPKRLRIGVLPDESREVLNARLAPLMSYLEASIGIPCDLVVPDSYEALLSIFRNGDLDVAYFGGFTFVAAHQLAGARPMVMRARDLHFVSYYLVPPDCVAESIDDFAGARFAFGSELSTSGHLMPRHFLLAQGITPETFFGTIEYTGAHDATVYAVRDGRADIGVANALVVHRMQRDGRLGADDLRVFAETPPYVDYVWAARADLPEAVRWSLEDAFLALDPAREPHRAVLEGLEAGAFFPASSDQFDDMTAIVNELGLIERLR